jgi:hypothetical protein
VPSENAGAWHVFWHPERCDGNAAAVHTKTLMNASALTIITLFYLILAGLLAAAVFAQRKKARIVSALVCLVWSAFMLLAADWAESLNHNAWYSDAAYRMLGACVGAIESGHQDAVLQEMKRMTNQLEVTYEHRGNFRELAQQAASRAMAAAGDSTEQLISGTDLKLVGRYEPLRLHIYVDTTSTNQLPDFAIFQGNECLIQRENDSSNTVETAHFEKGFNLLRTLYNDHGSILRRSVNYGDDSGRLKYAYIDRDGDGLWDTFITFRDSESEATKVLMRSNLCWVPIPQGDRDTNHDSVK